MNSKTAAKMAAAPFRLAYQDSLLSYENKLVVFSVVLGVRHFNQTIRGLRNSLGCFSHIKNIDLHYITLHYIHFARRTMVHC